MLTSRHDLHVNSEVLITNITSKFTHTLQFSGSVFSSSFLDQFSGTVFWISCSDRFSVVVFFLHFRLVIL